MSAIKLVRRGSSAAAAPPVTGGLPFYGSWPAASGEWPIPWTTVLVNGGSITQSSGAGLLQRSGNGFTATYPVTAAAADVDMLIRLSNPGMGSTHGCVLHALLRWGGGMGIGSFQYEPASCYGIRYRRTGSNGGNIREMHLYSKDSNGGETLLYNSGTMGIIDSIWVRFQVQGNAIRLKYWLTSSSEPLSWTYEGVDDSHSGAGYVAVAYGNAGYAVNREITIHSFALTAPI